MDQQQGPIYTALRPGSRRKRSIDQRVKEGGNLRCGLLQRSPPAGAPSIGADGFAPASLLSVSAFPKTFLHNGALDSLDSVLDNVTHRSAGTGGVDTPSNPADRAKVVRFIQSIDASTDPIPTL